MGRSCAFGTKKTLATEAQRTQRRDKSFLGKDLRKVKKNLKFPILPFGYLRVWPKSYLVAGISSKKSLDADLEAEKLKCKTQNQNSKLKTTDKF